MEGVQMTFAKGLALVLGFVGAMALGVWFGPYVTHRGVTVGDATPAAAPAPADVDQRQPARKVHRASPSRADSKPTTAAVTPKAAERAETTARAVPVSAPALHERLKPLLKKGVDMGLASQDFSNA